MIESSDVAGPAGGYRYVIDKTRDVWLQFVSGILNEPESAFVLMWQGKAIPFNGYYDERPDEDGTKYMYVQIRTFGVSSDVTRRTGIQPVEFDSEEEKEIGLKLAAEALLVFGSVYNGLSRPEGRYRVHYSSQGHDRVVTLASFGYRPPIAL